MFSNKSLRFLLPATPIIIGLVYFSVKSFTTPSSKSEIQEIISNEYRNNEPLFIKMIDDLRASNTVWHRFEINFHPGLGIRFQGYGLIDTSIISYEVYKNKFVPKDKQGSDINYFPDFDLNFDLLTQIKQLEISRIEYYLVDGVVKIKFRYEDRKFKPYENSYFIQYSPNLSDSVFRNEKQIIWFKKLNDSIYYFATG